MKKNHRRLLVGAAVATVALGSATVAMAEAEDTASQNTTVQVTGGSLEVNLEEGALNFGQLAFAHDNQQVNGETGTLTVDDSRGETAPSGWHITIESTNLDRDGGGATISNENLQVTATNLRGGEDVQLTDGQLVLDSARLIMEAGEGDGVGVYDADLAFDLTVPAATAAGTYDGSVTVSAISGPQGEG